jgi:hypothetical protein
VFTSSCYKNKKWKTMVDEQALRSPTFEEGTRIRLADGQAWSFPDHPPYREDDEHQLVLTAIGEAEDESERLRAELALAILLLSRNYNLTPADFEAILGYAPDDPALGQMQQAVRELATQQCQALRRLSDASRRPTAMQSTHWTLADLLKRRNRVESPSPRWPS